MSVQPLKILLTTFRTDLTKLDQASLHSGDSAALAELKTFLRLRIATLEVALRRVEELAAGRE